MRLTVAGGMVAFLAISAGVVHWKISPLPETLRQVYTQVRNTHWVPTR